MKKFVVALILSLGIVMSSTPAYADKALMVVIGDSISASADVPYEQGGFLYNDRSGSSKQAWWSMLRRETGMRAQVFAEGGSGYNKPGRGCRLSTFAQRVQKPEVTKALRKAKVIVIEGGINDEQQCGGTMWAGIDSTMGYVKSIARKDAKIIVTVPWANGKRQDIKHRNVSQIRSGAYKYGFTYVNTTNMPKKYTFDDIHPNRKGINFISDKIKKRLDIRARR